MLRLCQVVFCQLNFSTLMDENNTNTPAADVNTPSQPVVEETKTEETVGQAPSAPETEQPAA